MDWIGSRLAGIPIRWRIGAGLLGVYVLWGSTFLAIRLAVDTIPPFHVAAVRWCLAGGLLYAVARPAGGSSWRAWGVSLALSVLMVVLSNGGVTWAETRVPSGLAALGIATVAPWLVVLEALRPGGRRPTALTALGVGVGVVGVGSLVDPSSPVDGPAFAALLGAAFAFALGSTIARVRPESGGPVVATARQMLAGGGLLVLVALVSGETVAPGAVSTTSLAAMAWLVLCGSIAGFTVYSWLVQVAPPAVVGTYSCVNPVVALTLGAWLVDEPLTARTVLAGGLVVAGVALVTVGQALRRTDPPAAKVDWSARVA